MRMMCPGISYSTVHSLIFHNDGSVQDNKLFQEFCNRKQANFGYDAQQYASIQDYMIDNDTLTLLYQPDQEKYDDTISPLTSEYEIITTFMRFNNVSATFERISSFTDPQRNSSYQIRIASAWCSEGKILECCPPM